MPTSPRQLYMHFDEPDLAEGARECEAATFAASEGSNRAVIDAIYAPYEEQCVFLTVSDDDGLVHAAARFITPGPAGLFSLHDMKTHGWHVDGHAVARDAGLDLSATWDIATFSRRPGVPGGNRLGLVLSHGLVLAGRANRASSMIAIMDERVRSYLAMFGLVYLDLPSMATLPYYGSPASTPIYAHLPAFVDTIRRLNPEGYRLVGLGMGMDGISVPPLPDFVLRTPARLIDLTTADSPAPSPQLRS